MMAESDVEIVLEVSNWSGESSYVTCMWAEENS